MGVSTDQKTQLNPLPAQTAILPGFTSHSCSRLRSRRFRRCSWPSSPPIDSRFSLTGATCCFSGPSFTPAGGMRSERALRRTIFRSPGCDLPPHRDRAIAVCTRCCALRRQHLLEHRLHRPRATQLRRRATDSSALSSLISIRFEVWSAP